MQAGDRCIAHRSNGLTMLADADGSRNVLSVSSTPHPTVPSPPFADLQTLVARDVTDVHATFQARQNCALARTDQTRQRVRARAPSLPSTARQQHTAVQSSTMQACCTEEWLTEVLQTAPRGE